MINEFAHLFVMTLLVALILPLGKAFVPQIASGEAGRPLPTTDKGRVLWFDLIRGLAIIGVVLIHVNELMPGWAPAVVTEAFNTFWRFALPIFFVASGALLTPLYESGKSYRAFLVGVWWRLGLPYVVVVLGLSLLRGDSVQTFLYNLVTGEASVPFYFLIILFQLYMLYPYLERWARRRWFVFAVLALSIVAQFMTWSWHLFEVPLCFRFLFFFVWGIHLREALKEGRLQTAWWTWISLLILFWVVYAIYPGHYYNGRFFYGISTFMLLYLLYQRWGLGPFEQGLAVIGQHTLWIFLLHYPLLAFCLPWFRTLLPLPDHLAFSVLAVSSIGFSLLVAVIAEMVYDKLVSAVAMLSRRTITRTPA